MDSANGGGDACSIIVRKATNCDGTFANTALRCDFTTQIRVADTTNSFAVAAGDCVDIFFDETAGTCNGIWSWTFEVAP